MKVKNYKIKKTIFLFLFVPSVCFSQISGYIEYGQDIFSSVAYTEMQIGYIFRPFNFSIMPYANINTWMEMNKNSGSPFRDVYTFGFDFVYNKITINASHFCSHYVESGWDDTQYHRYNDVPLGGNLTKISARYDF